MKREGEAKTRTGKKGFSERVWEATKRIPKGRVSTYSLVAKEAGSERACRAAGNALNRNPFAPVVPCHRVVKSDGTLGGFAGGKREKKKMLEKEGIKFFGAGEGKRRGKEKISGFEKAVWRFRN